MSYISYTEWIGTEKKTSRKRTIPWSSIERVRGLWLGQAFRTSLGREDAEDLFQDALLAALEGMDRLRIAENQDPEDAFIAWFWGILRHKRVSYQRRRKRIQELMVEREHQINHRGGNASEETAVHLSLGLFERSSPEGAQVLRKRFLEGHQLEELASEMGVSVPTACRRVKSALNAFRGCVEMIQT